MALHRLQSSPLVWGLGLGFVIALGVLMASVFAVAGDGPTTDGTGLPPFYLEATLEMEDVSRSIGTQPAGTPPVGVHRRTQVRWLQNNRDEARVELKTIDPAAEAGTDLIVYDGTTQWYYRHETNTYSQSPLQPLPEGVTMRVRPWSWGALIGPWYGPAASVEEFMSELRQMSSYSTDVRVTGKDRLLGREVVVVEQSPVSTSSSGAAESRQGVARYWLDEERMVILRITSDNGLSQRFTVEVTKLQWNPPREPISFSPPAGSTPKQELDLSNDVPVSPGP